MANPDAAFGFRPIGNDGGVYTGTTQRCVFPTTSSDAAYIGSPVKMAAVDAVGTGGAQAVLVCTQGDIAYGVVVGFEADPNDLSLQYRKAATERYCRVVRADNALFAVQEDASIGLAGVGYNAHFTSGGGSSVTGYASVELDSTSINANSDRDLQVVEGADLPNNDLTASNAVWIVKFNDPQGKPVRTGT